MLPSWLRFLACALAFCLTPTLQGAAPPARLTQDQMKRLREAEAAFVQANALFRKGDGAGFIA